MELNELKATWQRMEEALERGNRLSAEMLNRQRVEATQKTLKPLERGQIFQILFGVFFIVLAALLWATKPTALSVILSGVSIQAYGIGCIVTAGLVFSSLRRIDYAGPVVSTQTGLAEVRKTYGISVLIAGLSWWFLWIPLLNIDPPDAHFGRAQKGVDLQGLLAFGQGFLVFGGGQIIVGQGDTRLGLGRVGGDSGFVFRLRIFVSLGVE